MDNLTKPERSALMSRIRGDGLKPETRVAAALRANTALAAAGAKILRNALSLPGRPDVVVALPRTALAVFVHGCFWHGCPEHYRTPKTRSAHWDAHVGKNRRRDERVRRQLRRLGYRTAVIWEHSVKTEAQAALAAERIKKRILCGH